jgi:hypothetical protein
MSKPPFQEVKKRAASLPRAKDTVEQASTPRRQPRRQQPRRDTSSDTDDEPTLAQQVQDLRFELLAATEAFRADMRPQPGPSASRLPSPQGDCTQQAASRDNDVAQWSALVEDLPQAPELTPMAAAKLYKLAKEVKRLASLMTTGRDLHDIHTILHLLAQWPQLPEVTQRYAAHRLKLL